MVQDMPTIYSIGHSDHEIDEFIELLERFDVEILADVRSQPYSRWVPQYNRETLVSSIEDAGLRYIWLGDSLGGRPEDDSLYEVDRPNYERMRKTADYLAGIDDLLTLMQQGTVAMMCAEGDHRRCHRTLLITPTLRECDVSVVHIQRDGRTVEATDDPEQLSLF